ncbi:hypothetical protein [Streptomyces albidoflavus]|uniref:hypothetical protein n=1 Tax=Streptomyces albidoflavus TaxID=1886 RepID=UPI0033C63433
MEQVCGSCSGSGKILVQRQHNIEDNPGGSEYEEQTCGTCNGSGRVAGGNR